MKMLNHSVQQMKKPRLREEMQAQVTSAGQWNQHPVSKSLLFSPPLPPCTLTKGHPICSGPSSGCRAPLSMPSRRCHQIWFTTRILVLGFATGVISRRPGSVLSWELFKSLGWWRIAWHLEEGKHSSLGPHPISHPLDKGYWVSGLLINKRGFPLSLWAVGKLQGLLDADSGACLVGPLGSVWYYSAAPWEAPRAISSGF